MVGFSLFAENISKSNNETAARKILLTKVSVASERKISRINRGEK